MDQGHQIRETLALHQHMSPCCVCSKFGLALSNSLDQCPVFLKRLRHAVTHLQLHAAIGLESVFQSNGLLYQVAVSTGLVNELVKGFVCAVVTVGVASICFNLTLLHDLRKFKSHQSVSASCCETCAHGFEFGHDLEHGDQSANADFSNVSSALGLNDDQPTGFKLLQSFPNRRPRDLKLRSNLVYVQLYARAQTPFNNVIFQLLSNTLDQGC